MIRDIRKDQGNIFAALFAGVALVGILGVAAMSFIRGPLTTMTNTTRVDGAKTQMQMAAQLSILAATADSGQTPYARVFATLNQLGSGGNLGGLTGADTTCQTLATAANLPGTYRAWLSDNTGSPSTRFTQLNSPYRLVNGVTIANNWADLIDGTLAAGISRSQTGTTVSSGQTWTGTLTNGTRNVTSPNYCNNWTNNTSGFTGTGGEAFDSDSNWTQNFSGYTCNNTSLRLYCFQQSATPDTADCDNDTYIEPFGFKSTTGPKPVGGGLIPDEIAATKQDPWGSAYGYCAWNHGSDTTKTCGTNGGNRLRGTNAQTWTSIAIISAGPDKTFQTTCSAFVDTTPADGNPDTALVAKTGGSDDVIFEYTYANAVGASGGLWQLRSGNPNVAALTSATRTADVRLADQTALGASSCVGVNDLGRVRYDTVTAGLQVCNFVGTYDWRGISGGGTSTIDGLSDGIAEYATLFNVFLGDQAGAVSTGGSNTGVGANVLRANTTGTRNVAIGSGQNATTDAAAMRLNTTGADNVAIGLAALSSNTAGNDNVAIGLLAAGRQGSTASGNTAIGAYSLSGSSTQIENTAAGAGALSGNRAARNTALGYKAGFSNFLGVRNTAAGYQALFSNSLGTDNTAVGYFALSANTASNNTAFGYQALQFNITGASNTAAGTDSLQNASGNFNVAVGRVALRDITGSQNVGVGVETLLAPSAASNNVAIGAKALSANTANDNVAIGANALTANTTGTGNTGFGNNALFSNVTSNENTGIGIRALDSTTAGENTAIGSDVMLENTTGTRNVGASYGGLQQNTTGSRNVGINGLSANISGDDNVGIGGGAGPTSGALSNTIAIGRFAEVTGSNRVRLGNIYIGTIEGQVAFTATSDRRLKKDITESDLGLEFVMGLKPVSYRMKDGNGRLDYGFIAQDVAALMGNRDSNMVYEDNDKNKTYKLRHTDLIAPVVKAIQEDEVFTQDFAQKLEAQQKIITYLQKDFEAGSVSSSNLILILCAGIGFGFLLVVLGRRLWARQGGEA